MVGCNWVVVKRNYTRSDQKTFREYFQPLNLFKFYQSICAIVILSFNTTSPKNLSCISDLSPQILEKIILGSRGNEIRIGFVYIN